VWRARRAKSHATAGFGCARACAKSRALLFAALLRRNRAELHKPEVFARLGFLYDGYSVRRGMFAWESVVMVRKAAIVMIGSLIKDAYRQIFASVALLIIALFLQANFQPYEKKRFNM